MKNLAKGFVKKTILLHILTSLFACSTTKQILPISYKPLTLDLTEIYSTEDFDLQEGDSWSTFGKSLGHTSYYLQTVNFDNSDSWAVGRTVDVYKLNDTLDNLEHLLSNDTDTRLTSFLEYNDKYYYVSTTDKLGKFSYEIIQEDKKGVKTIIEVGNNYNPLTLPVLYLMGDSIYWVNNQINNETLDVSFSRYSTTNYSLTHIKNFNLDGNSTILRNGSSSNFQDTIAFVANINGKGHLYVYQRGKLKELILENEISTIEVLVDYIFIITFDKKTEKEITQLVSLSNLKFLNLESNLKVSSATVHISENVFIIDQQEKAIHVVNIDDKNNAAHYIAESTSRIFPNIFYIDETLIFMYFNEEDVMEFYKVNGLNLMK